MNRRTFLAKLAVVAAALPVVGGLFKPKPKPPLGLLDDWRYVSAFEAQEVANYAGRRGDAKMADLDFSDLARGMAKIWPPL